jgi:hypothetical protein
MDDKINPPSQKQLFTPKKKDDVILVDITENIAQPIAQVPIPLWTQSRSKIVMPELRGMSMRKAMTTIRNHKLKCKLDGSGSVAWQSPTPGSFVTPGTVCVLGLK